MKRKKLVIGVAIALVVFLAAIIYVMFFDHYVDFKGLKSDKIKVEYGEEFKMPDVTAIGKGHFLNRKGTEVEYKVEGKVDDTKLGNYELKYSATYRNKTTTKTVVVSVVDTKEPKLSLIGDEEITVDAGTEYTESGCEAVDIYDGDISSNVKVSGKVDTSKVDDYEITYQVKDSSGNEAKKKRTVHVVDRVAPEIALKGDATFYIEKGKEFEEPGFVATDNCDGDLSKKVKVSGEIDMTKAGVYTLTYKVSDKSDNEGIIERTVRVYEPMNANTVNPGDKVIYLTFDDGPGEYTQQLLDILDKYNVKATFFVTNRFSKYTYLIGEEARRGHTVAIHTSSHDYSKIYASVDGYFSDFNTMNDVITQQTGKGAWLCRFPGGTSNTVSSKYCSGIMTTLSQEVTARGFKYCDWNVASGDAGETTDTQQVVANVIDGCKNHNVSIVLQHDIKGYSVAGVEQIIQWGLSEGYTFLPITETTPLVQQRINN